MACLTLIGKDRNLACGVPPSGQIGPPVGAKIINASQIESFTVSGPLVSAVITLKTGSKAWYLEASNGSLVVNLSLKGGDVYPQQHDVSIEATLYGQDIIVLPDGRASTGGMNGQYIIAVNHGNGVYKVYGLGAPLEVLSVEGSSTGNGFVRTTFGVEDWQVGTTIYNMTAADYEALSTPVAAP